MTFNILLNFTNSQKKEHFVPGVVDCMPYVTMKLVNVWKDFTAIHKLNALI